ncbi:hypothetical protein GY065_06755 [Snodgrassella sp. ESL0323]|nr:hypothetical protein [Snodgrassella sp. ESL0323]NUF78614.1 hypothetical protein [Snodgrassella sp. ESL0323]
MQQNKDILIKKGGVGMYKVEGIWKGEKYTVGFNKGRVEQFYRNKVQ